MEKPRPIAAARLLRALALCGMLAAAGAAQAATPFKVRTISNRVDSISEFRPRIRADVVVWQSGTDEFAEVIRWDGTVRENLSQNGVADENPETDGVHIVWQQSNGLQHDIAVFDMITQSTTILSMPGDEVLPVVSGATLAWVRMVDADGEVFVEPGPLGNQITGNDLVENSLILDGEDLLWIQGDELEQTVTTSDDQHDVVVWNGAVQGLFILGGFSTDDIHPSIADGVVVWQAGPDGSGDIWYGDTLGTANPLYDGTDERNPDTDGVRVVWEHHDGNDLDLFRVNLASPGAVTPLTADSVDDVSPQIQGNNVVWVKQTVPGDSEIWVIWNGGAAEPIVKTVGNGRDDVAPQLDGEQFVFESCLDLGQPTELCDIVLVPEPRATLLAGVALLVLAGLATRSARRAVALAAGREPR